MHSKPRAIRHTWDAGTQIYPLCVKLSGRPLSDILQSALSWSGIFAYIEVCTVVQHAQFLLVAACPPGFVRRSSWWRANPPGAGHVFCWFHVSV